MPALPGVTANLRIDPPGGTFAGTFQLQRFVNNQGQLMATGLLTGVLTTATGATSVVRTISVPAAVTDPSCQILHLDLGPLNLNLLGLNVNLNRIILDITAESSREFSTVFLQRPNADPEPPR